MFLSIFVVSKFIVLGENAVWLSGNINFHGLDTFVNSTHMMDFLGGLSSYLLGTVLGNLPFMFVAFYGLYYSIQKLNLPNEKLVIILLILSLPSFGIWSSIAGKEAIGVFSLGVVLGYILDAINHRRVRVRLVEFIAFYLLFVFKIQYFFGITPLILYIHVTNMFNLQGTGKLFLFFLYLICVSMGLWFLRDVINAISFEIPSNFTAGEDSSTRVNTIWVNDYDVFYNSIYGMLVGFIGPTLGEASESLMKFSVLVESLIVIGLFAYVIFRILIKSLQTKKANIYIMSLLFISVFSFLFVHYPFGVLNPGSAIRYRTNFIGFLTIFVYFLHLKSKYLLKKGMCEKNSTTS